MNLLPYNRPFLNSRSTLGMVTASIVKAMQMINKLYKMVDAGMADKVGSKH